MDAADTLRFRSHRSRPTPDRLRAALLAGLGGLALLAGCGGDREAANPPATEGAVGPSTLGTAADTGAGTELAADVPIEARSGSRVAGTVQLRESAGRLVATVAITGLAPNAEHGFHVHENGDCSAPDAASAGAHFNPGGHRHGRPGGAEYHAGDLPNLRADANGAARIELPIIGLTLAQGATSIVNRSLVVHRDPDDHTSQPAGNSGPRIGCGVIRLTAADPGAAQRDVGDAAVNRAGAGETPATPTGGRSITPTTPTPAPNSR